MHTDASHRFERGADWGATALACDRVTELVLATAGGKLAGYNDEIARKVIHDPIQLERRQLRRILGQEIPEVDLTRILRRLGFELTEVRASSNGASEEGARLTLLQAPDAYTVDIPTWRMDIEREIDVIEEDAAIWIVSQLGSECMVW